MTDGLHLPMTKYYFKSKSTGNIVEVSESEYRVELSKQEYRLVSDSYKGDFNFRQDSHMVVGDNCCDCEKSTLYVEEADMPYFRKDRDFKMPEIKHILVCEGYSYEVDEGTFEEVKDNYDWERCMSACGDEYGNEKITLEIDRTDLPEDLLELHEKNIEEEYL